MFRRIEAFLGFLLRLGAILRIVFELLELLIKGVAWIGKLLISRTSNGEQ